ncbi:MAG: NINE protein [Raoultibacter sp.]
MDKKKNDAKTSINDEITAAEAELRAAQEKLDAAKAKASLGNDPVEAPVCAAPVAAASSMPASDTTVVPSGPIELEAEPVAPSTPESDPNWVPFTAGTAQAQTPEATQGDAYQQPTAEQTGDPAQGGYYWQQPQQDPYANQYNQPQNPYGSVPPQQPNYYQQSYAPIVSSKDHVAAGLLAIFLGSLGIHKFYLGYNTAGFIMLAVTILGGLLTFGLAAAVMGIIAFIEGILYLVKSQSEFEQIYVFNQREWF